MKIRLATVQDQHNVVALDGRITSTPKADYWASMFDQFVGRGGRQNLTGRPRRRQSWQDSSLERSEPGNLDRSHAAGF